MITRRIFVSGRVQGVFFRDWTVSAAVARGITGWVRNRHDGRVEVLATGESARVDQLVVHLRKGSPSSHVDEVVVEDAEPERFNGFTRHSTV